MSLVFRMSCNAVATVSFNSYLGHFSDTLATSVSYQGRSPSIDLMYSERFPVDVERDKIRQ